MQYKIKATSIPVLPEVVEFKDINKNEININNIPVGIKKKSLTVAGINLKDSISYLISSRNFDDSINFIDKLLPLFTDLEMSVFKRARNYKTLTHAKNANIIDYRRATGLEAVIGYLYLTNQIDRLNELLKLSVGENNEG